LIDLIYPPKKFALYKKHKPKYLQMSQKKSMTKPDMSFKLIGHNEPINSVAFSSNQTQIVSSSNDMNLYLWNIKKNKKPHKLSGHKSAITEVPQPKTLL
jgi:WD40 repeat protein